MYDLDNNYTAILIATLICVAVTAAVMATGKMLWLGAICGFPLAYMILWLTLGARR